MRSFARIGPTAALVLVCALTSCAATSGDSPACAGGCPAGRTCVAGLCHTPDALPSPNDTTRVVLTPVDVAVASSKGGVTGDALPATIALGRGSSGTVVLFLRFAPTWSDDADITSAFVVLDRVEGAVASTHRATLEASAILEPWSPRTLTWGRQPHLGVPEAVGATGSTAAASLRIDVTTLVRDWSRTGRRPEGIAISASGSDAFGATYALGPDSGAGPRLEAYFR